MISVWVWGSFLIFVLARSLGAGTFSLFISLPVPSFLPSLLAFLFTLSSSFPPLSLPFPSPFPPLSPFLDVSYCETIAVIGYSLIPLGKFKKKKKKKKKRRKGREREKERRRKKEESRK